MLAQNFKTAEELKITTAEQESLISVLHMLDRGELKWTLWDTPIPHGFNMSRVLDELECGTVGCICGWARKLNPDAKFEKYKGTALEKLFMPAGWSNGTDGGFTVEQAAHALRTYLVTGEPEWA